MTTVTIRMSGDDRRVPTPADLFWHEPRWLHKVIAKVGHFFWLPCPRCGREFGGHEWRYAFQEVADDPPERGRGRGVCPWCAGSPETIAHVAEVRRQMRETLGASRASG